MTDKEYNYAGAAGDRTEDDRYDNIYNDSYNKSDTENTESYDDENSDVVNPMNSYTDFILNLDKVFRLA